MAVWSSYEIDTLNLITFLDYVWKVRTCYEAQHRRQKEHLTVINLP